jgi:hypothetical protein
MIKVIKGADIVTLMTKNLTVIIPMAIYESMTPANIKTMMNGTRITYATS